MKKFLSLVLALIMTMSLVTVSAGAEDFTDAEDITYAEAVEVMSAVGVIDGYTDGSFNPQGGLTRGAAAKIICNMILGPTTAAALHADTAPYKDVPVDHTFAGYIAYCAQQGIITGYTDGTFRPAAPLTGYAFMKMLLGALGYDKDVEGYDGANWSINVAKRALNIGLNKGLVDDFNGVKNVTREEACLYAFNTLKATMVQYDSKTTVSVGGAEVVIAGSKAEEVEYKNGKYDGNIADDDLLQFAEKYFTKLKGVETRDDFGRPATQWKNGTSKVGTYVWTADAEYTAKVEKGEIYADLGLSKSQTTDEYAINGKAQEAVTLSKKDEDKIGVGNGVLTQVWWDDEAEYLIITSIETFVGKVNSVTKAAGAADRYVTIAAYSKNPGTLNTKFETEDFAAKDLVAYTAAWNEKTSKYDIKTVELLEDPITGTLTEWNGTGYDDPKTTGKSENNFTVDGEKYKYSDNYIVIDESGSESAVWNFEVSKTELNVYVDEYGYALFVDGVEAEKNYAAVIGIGGSNQYGSLTRGVTLLLPDGTKKEVTAKLPSGANVTTLSQPDGSTYESNLVSEPWADLVTYTVDEDGVYKLTVADNYNNGDLTGNSAYFKNGKSLLTLGQTNYYTTSETIFMVCTKDGSDYDYSVYTGYSEMPGIDAIKGIKGYAIKTNSDYTTQVDIVYIYADSLAGISGVDTYFVKKTDADIITNSDGSYYVLPAIVDGEETTVKVDATISDIKDNKNTSGVWAINNVIKNSKGIITSYNKVNSTVFNAANTVTGTVAANKVVLGIGGNGVKSAAEYWAYNDKTEVFVVDKDYKSITVSSVTAVPNDTNDTVYAAMDTDTKILTDVIIVEQDEDAAPVVDTTAYYSVGIAGTAPNSKNVQVVLYKADKDGNRTSGALTKAELKALGITDADITVTTAGDVRNLKCGDGETGTYYVAGQSHQWAFTDSAVAYFDGVQYDNNNGFTTSYGATAGFMKIHLDNILFEGKLTVSIANVGENVFHDAEVTLPLESQN